MALAGKRGSQLEDLLHLAIERAQQTIRQLAKAALKRFIKAGGGVTFLDETERLKLAGELAKALGTADLLARALLKDYEERVKKRRGIAEAVVALPVPLLEALEDRFIQPLPPERAANFFTGLVPTLGVDPQRFGELMQRRAFTLAVAADTEMLSRVQNFLGDKLTTGQITGAAQELSDILDAAGVGPANPQYAEMVVRTNLLDSWNQAFAEEMQAGTFFPVWQYLATDDDRVRPAHLAHHLKYFPKDVAFARVRDSGEGNPFNCRCVPIPIDQFEWEELQQQGARVEASF